jgi:hypothetical protein
MWRPPDGVRTRRVSSSSAGLGSWRRAARSASVSKPVARPVRVTRGPIGMPGSRRERSGTCAPCASTSMTTRFAGPQETPTPRRGWADHQASMRWSEVVAAWKPWHQPPAGIQGQSAGLCRVRLQRSQLAAGVFCRGASGCTGQPAAAHQRATSRGSPRPERGGKDVATSRGTGCPCRICSVCSLRRQQQGLQVGGGWRD